MPATKRFKKKVSSNNWKQHGFYALLLIIAMFMLGSVTACSNKKAFSNANTCETKATVKDMRGLDGCSYVLELENGDKLEPILDAAQSASTGGPVPTIKGIALRDGMKVTVSYRELEDRASICMAGKIVEVTCFSENSTLKE